MKTTWWSITWRLESPLAARCPVVNDVGVELRHVAVESRAVPGKVRRASSLLLRRVVVFTVRLRARVLRRNAPTTALGGDRTSPAG
jgi:hypothetical protein